MNNLNNIVKEFKMIKVNKKNKTEVMKKIPFVIPPNTFKGVYSNFAIIYHSDTEFIIDFVLKFENQAELVSRVIMSPKQVKEFQKALNKNIESFETKQK